MFVEGRFMPVIYPQVNAYILFQSAHFPNRLPLFGR